METKNDEKCYKGREWSCDNTHTGHLGGGCFTCESIRRGIDHRIEMGIEAEFFGEKPMSEYKVGEEWPLPGQERE